ncbi:hypothetical protein NOK12_39540 [Nocardioides sp. OK12]|nr:hypothetical protein NOK12_39540 [Nocardioides sp. OK12]
MRQTGKPMRLATIELRLFRLHCGIYVGYSRKNAADGIVNILSNQGKFMPVPHEQRRLWN